MKRLSDTAALLVAGRAASQLALLGMILLLVRLLPKEAFGVFEALLLAVTTAVVFGAFGIQSSYLYFLPRLEPRERRPFVTQSLLLQLGFSVPAGGIALLLGTLFFDLSQAGNPGLAAAVLLAFPAVHLVNRALELIYLALDHPEASAKMAAGTAIAVFGATTLAAWAVRTPAAAALAYLVAQGAVTGAGLVGLYRLLPDGDRWIASWARGREQLGYAVPLWLGSLAGDLNRRLDAFLLSTFWPMSTFAVYKVGAREVPLVATVTTQLTHAVLPSISTAAAEGDVGEVLRLWHWAIRHTALLVLPVFWFLIAFTEPFIVTLFTEAYADAALIFGIYLLLLPLRLTSYGGVLSGLGETRPVFRAALVSLGTNVGLSAALIPVLGWVGPAVATVAAQMVIIALLVRHLKRALATSWAGLLPWRTLLRIFIAAGAPALALAWLFDVRSAPGLVGVAVAYAASFLALAWTTDIVRSEDFDPPRRWLGAWIGGSEE